MTRSSSNPTPGSPEWFRREFLRVAQRGELSAERLTANNDFHELLMQSAVQKLTNLSTPTTLQAAQALVHFIKSEVGEISTRLEQEVANSMFALGTYFEMTNRTVTDRASAVQQAESIGEDLWTSTRNQVLARLVARLLPWEPTLPEAQSDPAREPTVETEARRAALSEDHANVQQSVVAGGHAFVFGRTSRRRTPEARQPPSERRWWLNPWIVGLATSLIGGLLFLMLAPVLQDTENQDASPAVSASSSAAAGVTSPSIPAGPPAYGYLRYQDEYHVLAVDVPVQWSERRGDQWKADNLDGIPDDEEIGPAIVAERDHGAFNEPPHNPGLFFAASTVLADDLTAKEFIDGSSLAGCATSQRGNFARGEYQGEYRLFDCESDTISYNFYLLVVSPRSGSYLALLEVVEQDARDRAARERALETFEVDEQALVNYPPLGEPSDGPPPSQT